jgi:hypothetical protein
MRSDSTFPYPRYEEKDTLGTLRNTGIHALVILNAAQAGLRQVPNSSPGTRV